MPRRSPLRSTALLPLLLLLATVLPACGGGQGTSRAPAPRSEPGATAPAAAVERFLRLAGEKEYSEMGWIFGTREGAILNRDEPRAVERRMYALASILGHEEFVIREQAPVPGRAGEAVRVVAQLRHRGRNVDVPFTAVRSAAGRWYVEVVEVEKLTAF